MVQEAAGLLDALLLLALLVPLVPLVPWPLLQAHSAPDVELLALPEAAAVEGQHGSLQAGPGPQALVERPQERRAQQGAPWPGAVQPLREQKVAGAEAAAGVGTGWPQLALHAGLLLGAEVGARWKHEAAEGEGRVGVDGFLHIQSKERFVASACASNGQPSTARQAQASRNVGLCTLLQARSSSTLEGQASEQRTGRAST